MVGGTDGRSSLWRTWTNGSTKKSLRWKWFLVDALFWSHVILGPWKPLSHRTSWFELTTIGTLISHEEFRILGFELIVPDEALWLVREWSSNRGKLSFGDGQFHTVVAWPRQRWVRRRSSGPLMRNSRFHDQIFENECSRCGIWVE